MIILLNDIEIGWAGNRIIKPSLQRDNIYAGLVVQYSKIYPTMYFEGHRIYIEKAKQLGMEISNNVFNYRKILFSRNEDNTSNDLLYNSPNYTIFDENEKNNYNLHINKVVHLGSLLKEHNFSNYLDDKDIKKIYKMFLMKNNKFLQQEHLYLPISFEDFENLKTISQISREPSENILNKFDKDITFKPKVKIFTKK